MRSERNVVCLPCLEKPLGGRDEGSRREGEREEEKVRERGKERVEREGEGVER